MENHMRPRALSRAALIMIIAGLLSLLAAPLTAMAQDAPPPVPEVPPIGVPIPPGGPAFGPPGELTISKLAFGNPADAPAVWTFIVESDCLAAPDLVTIDSAPTFDGPVSVTYTLMLVAADGTSPCQYAISEQAEDGWLSTLPEPIVFVTAGITVVEELPADIAAEVCAEELAGVLISETGCEVTFYDIPAFLAVQNRQLSAGSIYIEKLAIGAPDGTVFDFTITSPCLAAPRTAQVEVTADFGFTNVEDLPVVNDAGEGCIYNVEQDADGFVTLPASSGPVVVDLLANSGGSAVFSQKFSEAAEAELNVFKSTFGDAAPGATVDIIIDSDCLDAPITLTFDVDDTLVDLTVDGPPPLPQTVSVPVLDAGGNFCLYDATEVDTGAYIILGGGEGIPADPRGMNIGFSNIVVGAEIGTVVIEKLTLGDPASAPEFWEFTLSSPCFEPMVVTMPSADTFDEPGILEVPNVAVTNASGFCTVTVTETPVPGFAAQPPMTMTFEDGPFIGHSKVNFPAAASDTGALVIAKFGPVDVEGGPATFDVMIVSECLDEPLLVTFTSADIYEGSAEVIVEDLPVVDADGVLCLYEAQPVALDDHFHDPSPPTVLVPGDGGLLLIFKASELFGPDGGPVPAPVPPPVDGEDAAEESETTDDEAVEEEAGDDTPAAGDTDESAPISGDAAAPAAPAPAPAPAAPATVTAFGGAGLSTGPIVTASEVTFGERRGPGSVTALRPSVAASASTTAAASTSSAKKLAVTGTESGRMVSVGLGLLSLGMFCMGFARRREFVTGTR